MEESQETALTQMRTSVQKLGSSTEVVMLCFKKIMLYIIQFWPFMFSAEVWRPNTDEVLDCKINGPGEGSKDVCAVAEMEGFVCSQWVHFGF